MNIAEGSIVRIDGSDDLWEVVEVSKYALSLRDAKMGIIEIDDIPHSDVVDVIEDD